MKKRILSTILILCMAFTMMPMQAFATTGGESAIGTSIEQNSDAPKVCESHATHNEGCNYIEAKEAKPCEHLQADVSYTCDPVLESGSVSDSEATTTNADYLCDHSDGCGYAEAIEGVDCTHTCEKCAAVPEQANAVKNVLALIDALPAMDELEAQDTESAEFTAYLAQLRLDVAAARLAFEALTAEEKAAFDATVLVKLTELEGIWAGIAVPMNLGAITIKINTDTTEYSDNDLEAAVNKALNSANINTITTLTITGGKVTSADWSYIKSLTALTDFEIATAVAVADIPNGAIDSSIFPATIVNVTIPQSIAIGAYAFNGCTALKTASIPLATSIGEGAFNGCKVLETASFPLATSIGKQAFYNCEVLETADFPLVTTIGQAAFTGCKLLATASFQLATSIGVHAFLDCTVLKTVDFPKATTLGDSAFVRTAVESVSFPKATTIEANAFLNCKVLETASFPLATTIGDSAFLGCKVLASASFPLVTTIGNQAFYQCTTLATASFPLVTTFGKQAFLGCTALESASFPKATTINMQAFSGCTALESVSIPKATTIVANAFEGCTKLESVSFPVAASIEANAFKDCAALATLKLGEEPPTVANANAFTGTPSPRKLGLVKADGTALTGTAFTAAETDYDDVTANSNTAGDNKWYGCTITELDVIEITVSDGTTTVSAGGRDISEAVNTSRVTATDITTLTITGGMVTASDWRYIQYYTALTDFEIATAVAKVENIPNGTTSKSIFPATIVNVTIPQSITIGAFAFKGGTVLKTASIPLATKIGADAFNGCRVLETANFPLVTKIENDTFYQCTKLETVNFPLVTTIWPNAFESCASLKP